MELSILDQIPILGNQTGRMALQNAVELAQHGEKYGYQRMWFAEHHGAETLASSAPEIVIGQVAAQTEKIRVGSGGIMMMHYSPLKIAETFKTLEAFHPNRIDLGLGRAPGGDRNSIFALSQGKVPSLDGLYEKIDTIKSLLEDQLPKEEIYQATRAVPIIDTVPEMWLLGSSGDSAFQAAQKGIGYSFAQFFSGHMNKEAFEIYRSRFVPSAFMPEKKISVAFYALACENEEEARFYELPYAISKMHLARGKRMERFLTPEEAVDFPMTEMDRIVLANVREGHLVGTPKQIHTKLQEYQEEYSFEEAMIITITHPQKVRLESYRLLAEEVL
ncbi:LLM class flavin-dependent oxidoreductase [Jeotgalibaca caeni]|uniref:LLM class flavin-dependent oxidoreductase n=1 Tax=Jeotgalibaca caeni TaxID=3028623 RepID=UPI00237E385A|nr:LLM class flavin-dependent oxidoreductase [Jeotgalibaca caeni]MDE1549035.1 LLM class flavin-dependent oxidoreductase [Jeotgalibaca caeni]